MSEASPESASPSPTATAGVIAPPPLIALAALAAGIGASYALPSPGWLAQQPQDGRWAAAGVFLLGTLALEIAGSGRFRRVGTHVQPWKPTLKLVTDGIFAHVRNPMYVGFGLFQLAVALAGAFDWVLASTAVWAVFQHAFVVRREERYLEGLFGEAYRDYRARVRRYGLF